MTSHRPAGDREPPDHQAITLNRSECNELLRANHVGRLGFVNDGWPTILPVNYVLDGDDIIIRTDSGTKFASVRHGAEVSFELDHIDSLYRSGWSVLVHGYATEVVDDDELEHLRGLGLRAWHQGVKPFWIRIAPVLVTGRRLPKGWQYPEPTG